MSFFSLSGGLLCFFKKIILFPMAEFPRGVVKSSLILMLKDSIHLKVINYYVSLARFFEGVFRGSPIPLFYSRVPLILLSCTLIFALVNP